MFRRWLPVVAMLAALAWNTRASAEEAGAFAKPPDGATAAARQARGQDAARAFMMGRYEEALQIYVDLYVKSYGRVEYLRNIGRCQQRLGQHDLAIRSFKDYLLRGKMSAAERAEVKTFIAESEKAKTEAGVPAPAPTVSAAPAAPAPVPAPMAPAVPAMASPPASSPPLAPVPAAPTATVAPSTPPTGPAPPPAWSAPPPASPPPSPWAAPAQPPAPSGPGARDDAGGGGSGVKTAGRVLLIAGAVLAVGGTAALLVARSKFNSAKDHGCPGPSDCGEMASSVSTINHVSQAMYVGAAATGLVGGLMVLLSPPTESGAARVAVGARFNF